MARSDAIWGIDIGQCALKALRCRPSETAGKITADAFDYIEYRDGKILSQPDSDAEELVADALSQFLSRNAVRGDSVAISVSGQAGLARFIKLPPVEAKKIPDIVRYEARQQIPFDLNDVIWDYQRLGGGSEDEGFALETEIGLFAMKREAVFRTIEPFQKVGIEVDYVQLAPLALYNFAMFDLLTDLPPASQYDPENPPASLVMVSLGTDATDLVITNGYRVWQRSVPIGGSHFTKSLTKEMKLTFAKAEHLKRNASAAQDPKAVFQAMRPVFNEFLTQIQRSIGYFTSLDRNAKIGRVVAMGNAMKLPGLRRYLSQNLGFEIERLDAFANLEGPAVLGAPIFKDNALSFGPCYGLCLQGLGVAGLRTNLLPKEIKVERLIRRKKPWAVAAAAALMAGCGISFASYAMTLAKLEPNYSRDNVTWAAAEAEAGRIANDAKKFQTDDDAVKATFKKYSDIGTTLVGNIEGRFAWAEVLKVINDALPRDENGQRPEAIEDRRELHIISLDCQQVPDLAAWYAQAAKAQEDSGAAAGGTAPAPGAAPATMPGQGGAPAPMPGGMPGQPGANAVPGGPTGPGWVIQIRGKHYHNKSPGGRDGYGNQFVRNTLIHSLQEGQFEIPKGYDKGVDVVKAKDIGLDYAMLLNPLPLYEEAIADPNAPPDPTGKASAERTIKVNCCEFTIEMAWKKVSPSERAKAKAEEERKKAEAGKNAN